jgi:gliding motility-associated-like protein
VETADIYSAVAVDTNGCILSDSALITSDCPSLVSLDNVFTPNGDGINDLYCLRIQNVESATIEIYNRWGLLIQSTISPELCWDGKISGTDAQEGVYFYHVETRNFDETTASFRGSFSLLR